MKNFKGIIVATLIILVSCNEECDDLAICIKPECSTNCNLTPEIGQCNAAFQRYYFNKQTMKCDSFIWGGCNGVVPFETIGECNICGCK